jgi:beta-galactosidase/beta-glucuronidase
LLRVGDRWFGESIPSRVEIVQSGTGFVYVVNGIPSVIKGIGINTQYQSELSPSERRARLDADLAEMQRMGVNTLVGWDPAEFDGMLLDAAQRHDIGVVLPFDLSPDADYTDPSVRAELIARVLAWVNQYRNYSSLRMWGLGNEVLHKIVHPAWVGPQDPDQVAEARAFSDWLSRRRRYSRRRSEPPGYVSRR